jgi:tetratricopeptide (TPR) repeat protein
MKLAPLVLAIALCASCSTPPPGGAPAAPTADARSRSQQLAAECQTALGAGDFGKAQDAAGEAVRLDPQFEEAWVAYGMASVRLGQADRALQAYERALAVHQAREGQGLSDPAKLYQEIFLLSLLGRSNDAAALLQRAHAKFPDDQQLSNLATLFPEFLQTWATWAAKPPTISIPLQ